MLASADEGHIHVVLRTRPLLQREISEGEEEVITVAQALPNQEDGSDALIKVMQPPKLTTHTNSKKDNKSTVVDVQEFAFDLCAGPSLTQTTLFEQLGIETYCDEAMEEGKTATVMCFGQTGSGKTYTMSGRTLSPEEVNEYRVAHGLPLEGEEEDEEAESPPLVAEDGIQYRAVHYIVQKMNALRAADPAAQLILRASYLELYNETINDLLQGTSGLKCRWSAAQKQFFVEGLMLAECEGEDDLLFILREGQASRQRGGHLLNLDSSRSHVLFTIHFEYKSEVHTNNVTRYGKITFVDLAGSERLKETGNIDQKVGSCETRSINRSLFALGNVLEKLSDQQQKALSNTQKSNSKKATKASKKAEQHIDYRSSILTQLLMDSLNGSSKTLLVACVTPSRRFVEESLRTIYYAQRARSIRATPTQRVNLAEQEKEKVRMEIRKLKEENHLFRRVLGLPLKGPVEESAIRNAIHKNDNNHDNYVPSPNKNESVVEERRTTIEMQDDDNTTGKKNSIVSPSQFFKKNGMLLNRNSLSNNNNNNNNRKSSVSPPAPPPVEYNNISKSEEDEETFTEEQNFNDNNNNNNVIRRHTTDNEKNSSRKANPFTSNNNKRNNSDFIPKPNNNNNNNAGFLPAIKPTSAPPTSYSNLNMNNNNNNIVAKKPPMSAMDFLNSLPDTIESNHTTNNNNNGKVFTAPKYGFRPL